MSWQAADGSLLPFKGKGLKAAFQYFPLGSLNRFARSANLILP